MTLSADLALAYLDRAFDQMLATLERVAEEDLATPPFGAATTSISGLVTHSTEVSRYWLGHVGLGDPSDRDRDAEFTHRADRTELVDRIAQARAAATDHLTRLADGEGQASEMRGFLYGDQSDDSLVLHVVEELYQHLGHMEITADALAARRAP